MTSLRTLALAFVLGFAAAMVSCSGTPGGDDAGTPADAGELDAGASDAGARDAGEADAGMADAGDADAGTPDAGVDLDGDGLDDGLEASLARAYFPYLSMDPADGCPLGGVIYRAHPHPGDPTLVRLFFAHLYERDCGLNGHVGDNEDFGMTVDPAVPAPLGFKAIKSIGHEGTICQQVTSCGVCGGLEACETTDAGQVVMYLSKGKHAGYVKRSTCNPVTACLDTCAFNATPRVPPLVNVGEPGRPLVTNLTTQGFITADAGWSEPSVFDFDPWDAGQKFGAVSGTADRLVDPVFVTPACR